MEQFAESTNGEAMVVGERLIQRQEVVVPREQRLLGLHDIISSCSSDDGMDIKISSEDENLENNVYLDEDKDDKSGGKENPEISLVEGKTKHVKFDNVIEGSGDDDDDVIEVEFERDSKRLDTHTVHCPKCDACITKVILRKKRARKEPCESRQNQQPEAVDILGCSSCYSVFIPSGNCFSWIRLFGNGGKDDVAEIPQQPNLPTKRDEGMVIDQEGDCFSLFRIFGNKTEQKNTKKPTQESSVSGYSHGESLTEQGNGHVQNAKRNPAAAPKLSADSNDLLPHHDVGASVNPNVVGAVSNEPYRDGEYVGHYIPRGPKSPEDWKIQVEKEGAEKLKGKATSSGNARTSHDISNESDDSNPINSSETRELKSLEVLKSVVYGGLMESITSLGIVTSVASSEATTSNIITIGLANLIGGLVIIGHNLGDLKSDQSEGASNKYQELLGRKENFLLHATFAVVSFLVCGLIPPATYGFTFEKIHDKNLTLVAVAVASLLCISLLAIGKAYITYPKKFYAYITTIMYYVSIAVMVSGVTYAVGDLINKLIQSFGWFETNSPPLFLPDMQSTNSVTWASY